MITVKGIARLRVPFTVQLNMTEEAFDALSERAQNQKLEDAIDWHDACRSATTDEFEVDDVTKELSKVEED